MAAPRILGLAPADPAIHSSPGELHAALVGDSILVPRDVLAAFARQRLRNAEDLYAYMTSFPTASAHLLNWSVDDCGRAIRELETILKRAGGAVPPKMPIMGLGALNPDVLGS